VPVFHDGEVVAYIQAFGLMTMLAAACPVRCGHGGQRCSRKASRFRGEDFRRRRPHDAVFTIVRRNTRVAEMLSADLDSEIQAC